MDTFRAKTITCENQCEKSLNEKYQNEKHQTKSSIWLDWFSMPQQDLSFHDDQFHSTIDPMKSTSIKIRRWEKKRFRQEQLDFVLVLHWDISLRHHQFDTFVNRVEWSSRILNGIVRSFIDFRRWNTVLNSNASAKRWNATDFNIDSSNFIDVKT